ncbi:MAG: F0F1 ATP synthase subunit A [Acidobacteriota bacterium]
MSPEVSTEIEQVAEHATGERSLGDVILHHVSDSNTLEFPPLGEIHLPQLELFGIDISITKHVVMMWVAALLLIVGLALMGRRRRRVPKGLSAILEMFVVFIRDEIAVKNIGKEGIRHVPYLLTTFFFILICNLLGLIPWGSTPTGNLMVTAALAIVAFLAIQAAGVQQFGFLGYLRSLVPQGVPPGIREFILGIEFIGMLTKPFALCMRLFANMLAGHIVILALLGLIFVFKSYFVVPVSIGLALFIYMLEIFVAFLQAYIFTMLTAVFIGMTRHPAH